MIHELNLENLLELDGGRVAAAFQLGLKRASLDCDDRPGESKARIVSLQCEITPIVGEDGYLEDVNVKFQVTDKVPTRKSRTYSMGFRKGGSLVFNDLSDDNINQATIDEIDE